MINNGGIISAVIYSLKNMHSFESMLESNRNSKITWYQFASTLSARDCVPHHY